MKTVVAKGTGDSQEPKYIVTEGEDGPVIEYSHGSKALLMYPNRTLSGWGYEVHVAPLKEDGQPDWTKENSAVFDIKPTDISMILEAAGTFSRRMHQPSLKVTDFFKDIEDGTAEIGMEAMEGMRK